MALTYRSAKGTALTITELDNNFRHFTGSHSVTGSLTVSAYSEIPYQRPITNSLGATNFTCSSNEAGNFILAGDGTTACTMSIGTNAEKPNIPIGAEFVILNTGSIAMAFTASAGITLYSQLNFSSTGYSSGTTGKRWDLKKLGTDTWSAQFDSS